jgi:hypothetical protein
MRARESSSIEQIYAICGEGGGRASAEPRYRSEFTSSKNVGQAAGICTYRACRPEQGGRARHCHRPRFCAHHQARHVLLHEQRCGRLERTRCRPSPSQKTHTCVANQLQVGQLRSLRCTFTMGDIMWVLWRGPSFAAPTTLTAGASASAETVAMKTHALMYRNSRTRSRISPQ